MISKVTTTKAAGIEVEFTVEWSMSNDGIGAYEYWGCSGYDSGRDYVDIESIEWDESLYTPEENKWIYEDLEKAEEYICEQLMKSNNDF